jgi:hypothetical protein
MAKTLGAKIIERWWGSVLAGAVMLIIAVNLHSRLSKLETGESKTVYVDTFTATLHRIAGKWPPVILFSVMGCFLIGYGIKQFLDQQKKM